MDEIDTEVIKETALRLAQNVSSFKKRDFISKIEVGKEPRIKVLRGFRGLGKTTALLQLMGGRTAYFTMDDPHVRLHSLYDVGRKFIMEGSSVLLIDEIHLYRRWKEDTKALYDEFPGVTLVVSGSAPLAFEPERRYEVLDVDPLSIREFIELGGGQSEVSEGWQKQDITLALLASNPQLYEAYKNYIDGGAFPIWFAYREKTLGAIYNSIKKSITEDAIFLSHVDGEMVFQMERAVLFLASATLGEFSINGLSKNLGFAKNKAYRMISLLESMRILRMVRPYGRGAKLVRGDPKLMFYHPVLRKAVCAQLGIKADIGAMREEMAVFSLLSRGWTVSTIKGMKRNPDYIIEKGGEKIVVEIGGDSKSSQQLKGIIGKTLVIGERQQISLGLF